MPELYKFYTDQETWLYNDGKRVETYASEAYDPQPIRRDRIRKDISDQSAKIIVPLTMPPFDLYPRGNPATSLWLEILSTAGVQQFLGKVAGVEFEVKEGTAQVSLFMFSRMLLGDVPSRRYSASCPWDLFDGDCTLTANDFRVQFAKADTTIGSDGLSLEHATIGTEPDGYWSRGYVKNGTERAYILSHVGDVLTLLNPFLRLTNVNFELFPGCDKSVGTCNTKFSNVPNFGGFPVVPNKNPVTSGL